MAKKISKTDLFLRLAQPDDNGVSRWVKVTEFTNEYTPLQLGNGGSWRRKSSLLARRYNVEFCKTLTSGNSIDAIRLNGYKCQIINIANSYPLCKLIKKPRAKICLTCRRLFPYAETLKMGTPANRICCLAKLHEEVFNEILPDYLSKKELEKRIWNL